MEYTKQDVFRHKISGTLLLYCCPDDETDLDEDQKSNVHVFSSIDDYFYWDINEVEYVGRSSKIVLRENAVVDNDYFIGGSGNGCFDGEYQLLEIDMVDDNASFRVLIEDDRNQWCRHLLTIPFDEVQNNLDITPNSNSSKLTCTLSELSKTMKPREVSNSTISSTLQKLPKALI